MRNVRFVFLSLVILSLFPLMGSAQDDVYTISSDPIYITMDAPFTVYVNVLSEDVLSSGNTIDPDSLVTAYTGLITLKSDDYTTSWKHVVNSSWNDISLEMTKENDSVFSYTIDDPSAFYNVDPDQEAVFRIAFIARGTSNGAIDGQTENLFFEVYAGEPTEEIAVQPSTPYADSKAVITFNSEVCDCFTDYHDTIYAHTGLITTESPTNNDWRFVLADWGTNNNKTRLMQVSDSIYRYYIFPSIHQFYGTENAENVEKLAFVFRSKADPYMQTGNLYVDVMDTITIEVPEFLDNAKESAGVSVYPNPASDIATFYMDSYTSEPITLRIHSLVGKTIFEKKYTLSGDNTFRVNLNETGVVAGELFLYSIEADGKIRYGKILIAQ